VIRLPFRILHQSAGSRATLDSISKETHMPEKLVIIGSGPAAWTAAIYAARANLMPLVFAGSPNRCPPRSSRRAAHAHHRDRKLPRLPHGVTGPKLMSYMEQQAVRFGTRIQTDDGQHPDVSDPDDGHSYKYHDCERVDLSARPFKVLDEDGSVIETETLIVATAPPPTAQPAQRATPGRSGGGVSACAVCDGALPVFRGKELGVVGGGDSAIEEATHLTSSPARSISFTVAAS